MPTIHWKPEVNALTIPQSYKIRFIPNNNLGTDDIAAGMVEINPALTPDLAKSSISALFQTIQKNLINGNHITLNDSFIFTLSFTGRLNSSGDPLPPIAETLHVRIHPTANFMKQIHHQVSLERKDITEKLPQINQVEDTSLRLNNVLSSTDVLQLTGENLNFDPLLGNGECIITGTRGGNAVQTQFGPISNTSIILIPSIPTQDNSWNNEYILSVSVRYTEHGTLRTGTYRRRLRSPLVIPNLGDPKPPKTGILTGKAAAPSVLVTGGTISADERLRVQVLQNLSEERLLFSLIDMREGGSTGEELAVMRNGKYILPGFADSALSTLNITVNNYAGLWDMIRNDYSGRLIDVLDIKMA